WKFQLKQIIRPVPRRFGGSHPRKMNAQPFGCAWTIARFEAADYFCSFASQSRDWASPFRSNSILPLMEPFANVPEYLLVTVLSLNVRTTPNEMVVPVTLPSLMSVEVV